MVFREARRTLKNNGTLWLNIGDNYVGATSQHKDGGSQGKTSRYSKKHMNGIPTSGRSMRNKAFYAMGLPMKSLVGMPWRIACIQTAQTYCSGGVGISSWSYLYFPAGSKDAPHHESIRL
jgi:hypothetical protein